MDKSFQAPKGSLLPTLVVFLFVLGLLYALFLFTQQLILKREITRAEATIAEIEDQVKEYRKDKIEEISNARDLSEQVQASRIEWSGVVKRIQALTPAAVFYSSYSAGNDGAVQLAGFGDSYEAVAAAIEQLDRSTDFVNTFVPSVSRGNTGDGRSVASFSISFEFRP